MDRSRWQQRAAASQARAQQFAPLAPRRLFDASLYPNAVTIGDLIAERMGMGVHCHKCARHVVIVRRCRSACNFDPLSWGIGVQN